MKQAARQEIKYLIPMLKFYEIKRKLDVYMTKDIHTDGLGYRVRSLYFDMQNDGDLMDVLDGMEYKQKIRLRVYPNNLDKIWLEYKQKSDTKVYKRAIKIDKATATALIDGRYSVLLGLNSKLAEEIYIQLRLGGYRPKVIVAYNRLAYEYPINHTRITYDTKVSATYGLSAFFDENLGKTALIAPDHGVLEVKYDHILIGVLQDIVSQIDALNEANSKYMLSRLMF